MSDDYRHMEQATFKDEEQSVPQLSAMIQGVMATPQQSSVRLLIGGMSQEEEEHLNKQQQQQQLLMQKMMPSSLSSEYPSPLYSLASNSGCSDVRSTPSTNRMRNSDKRIVCNLCYEVFSSKPNLLIHSQEVHRTNPKPYQCPTCSKCFANSSYLSQHSRIHLGIKPYICPLCHRRFTQLCHLQQHIRTHTGEKPYKCQHLGCTKAFSQLSNLQSHLRSHVNGHVNGHVHGPRSSQPYRCHSCCRQTGADQANSSEPCRCYRMAYHRARDQDHRSDFSYQVGLRRQSSATPLIRHRLSSGVHTHVAVSNDAASSAMLVMPTLSSLGGLSERESVLVRSEEGDEGGSTELGDHLRARGKDSHLLRYDSVARKCSSEAQSRRLLSNTMPFCCEASRASEKCGGLNAPGTLHSSAVVATAATKKGAFLASETNGRLKVCDMMFMDMNAGMRGYKKVSDKVESMGVYHEIGLPSVEISAGMKGTCSSRQLDEFGSRRKSLELLAIDGSRESKNRDHFQNEKKETFFSEVPRVNIDQPLSSSVYGPLNSPLFPASYNPF